MPDTIELSADAVAVLRFESKGWRSKNQGNRLPAYRELTAAGIMEPIPGSELDYRFTDLGMREREEILVRESDRIERERYAPPDVEFLSESANQLLKRLVSGERVQVDQATKPAYRELAAARIMVPVSGFVTGPESSFRFTYWGWNRRHEWIALPTGLR